MMPARRVRHLPELALFAFALLLRAAYLAQQAAHNPLFDHPVVDAAIYTQWANEILSGRLAWPELRNYLPAYPLFLAGCEALLGTGPWAVKAVQAALSAAAAVMVCRVTKRVAGRRAGLIAGFLYASQWLIIVHDAERYSESLCLDALAVMLFCFVRAHLKVRHVVTGAVACTIACSCRTNLLPLAVLGMAWVARGHTPRLRRIASVAGFVSILAAAFVPVVWHNHALSGEWVLRAEQAWNVYAALEPRFGGLHPAGGIAFDTYMAQPVLAGATTHREIESYWWRESRRLLREQPGPVLFNYLLRRLGIFVDHVEWSQEFDVYAFRGASSLLSLPWPGFGTTFALAAVGLALVTTRRRLALRCRFLLTFLCLVALFTFLFKVTGRYRLPLTLALVPFAGIGLDALLRSARRPAWHLGGMLGLAVLATGPDWSGLSGRQTAHHTLYIAERFSQHGQMAQALAAAEQATHEQPEDAMAPYFWAVTLCDLKRCDEAVAPLDEALRREPRFWSALDLKGSLALSHHQYAAAVTALNRSIAAQNARFEPWILLSRAAFETHDWDAWRNATRQAMNLGGPAAFRITDALRLEQRGHSKAAAAQLLSAAGHPRSTGAERSAALLYAGDIMLADFGDVPAARSAWEFLVAQAPAGDPNARRARFLLGREPQTDSLFDRGLRALAQGARDEAKDTWVDFLQSKGLSPQGPPPETFPERWAWTAVRRL